MCDEANEVDPVAAALGTVGIGARARDDRLENVRAQLAVFGLDDVRVVLVSVLDVGRKSI